jgi:hypothetical protein
MTRMAKFAHIFAYFCLAIALVCVVGIFAEPEMMAGGLIAAAFWAWLGVMALSIFKGLRSRQEPRAWPARFPLQ